MSPLVKPVIIAYKSYPWIRVSLQSFRRHFPLTPILVIDNNPDLAVAGFESKIFQEREWLQTWRSHDPYHVFVKTDFPDKRHGLAMDYGAKWCRDQGITWMLHFEPDCLITGVEWARRLIDATLQGAWMAGSYQKEYGPIHPTPSIWDVRHISCSFETCERTQDRRHPRYHELLDEKLLMAIALKEGAAPYQWWENHWDTAIRAWFLMAVENRAKMTEDPGDLRHFWQGSTHNADPRSCNDIRVLEYL